MKLRILPFLVLTVIFLSGCPSYSTYPLYTSQDAVAEPALEGTWLPTSPEDEGELVFRKVGENRYVMVFSSPEAKNTQTYEVHFVRLGSELFMDLIFQDQEMGGTPVEDPLGVLSTHVIAKIKLSGDDFAYAALEDDRVTKEGASEKTKPSYVKLDGSLLLTAETDDLRRYVSAHAGELFSDFQHFKRKR